MAINCSAVGRGRRVSTCVEKERKPDKNNHPVLIFAGEGGHLASVPHSVELQFHALAFGLTKYFELLTWFKEN